MENNLEIKDDFEMEVVSIRLVKDKPLFSEHAFTSPLEAVAVLGDIMSEFDREVMCVINLRTDLKPINIHFASIGVLNEAMAHPRELLKASILSNAACMMLVHSHPSGNLSPSKEDTILTDRMSRICQMMGIPLVDHIIVGGRNQEFFSFKEKGMIQNPQIQYATDYKTLDIAPPLVRERLR